MIRFYLGHLKSAGAKASTISRHLSTIKSYMKFLCRDGILLKNPADKVNFPKQEQKIPKFMFESEIEALINSVEPNSYLKMRNKFLLEMLYSTGMRVSEVVSINLKDINFSASSILITGKGSKQRNVFFGKELKKMFDTYLEYRKLFLKQLEISEDNGVLFLNKDGGRLTDRGVRYIIEKFVREGAIQKKVSPHTFRHTFATHLLNRGADIRIVQEVLGHEDLSSTQIYTHITKTELVNMYNKFHKR